MNFETLVENCSRYKVLYVEDEEDVRNATYETIKELFNEVLVAKDGLEGLEFFKEHNDINIVISDVGLPKLSGLEMISLMKGFKEDLISIVISAHEDPKYLLSSIKLKIDGFLIKPLNLEEFSEIIKNVSNTKKKTNNFKELNQEIIKRRFDYIAVIDIENFSIVNKLYGKEIGDKILETIDVKLKSFETTELSVFKIESDKFTFLLKGKKDKILENIKYVLERFKDQELLDSLDGIEISFNVGISKISSDLQEMINAEYALQKAKESSLTNVYFYDPNDESIKKEKENVIWFGITKRLIREDAIVPFFQPIVNCKTKEISKFEVLSRGLLDGEEINPYFFIPIAEKTGLISEITRMIIKKSFAVQKEIKKELSINLSNQDLIGDYLIPFLIDITKEYGINPKDITFEIIENIVMNEQTQIIIQTLNEIKELGFQIAIDDFGADNSNFKRLVDIDCDVLKIDRIFIQNVDKNKKNRLIVQAIVNLAKTLKIETVAEFVENEEIFEVVKECGVDYAQGYYFGKATMIV